MREQLTDAEIIARLDIGLRRMTRMQREIFLAVRLDDMSYPEIAKRIGLSVRQVEKQFAKGFMQLDAALRGRAPVSRLRRLFRWITAKGRR
jgi:RNA polymerase sigma-70 factor (ECF subfamily)